MFKANVIDSSRFTALIDEKLKLKIKERMRPNNLFSDPYYQKSEQEKNNIEVISENTCKNMLKSIWNLNNERFKENFFEASSKCNGLFNNENDLNIKKTYYKKINNEKELEKKLEEFIKNTSPRKQKLIREYSTGIVLGDEDSSREKMISHISNAFSIKDSKEKDDFENFKLVYPSYSNIFNNENPAFESQLSEGILLKQTRMNITPIGDDCVAMLLTPGTLKYYSFDRETKTYNAIKDLNRKIIPEYNLDNVTPAFTPLQKNLSSKLHGSDFYNNAATRSSEMVSVIRFRLINISSDTNEKSIQNTAASCGAFAYQIVFEFDPIKWNSKGTATGMLRYSGDSLNVFKSKLLKTFNIKVEILNDIQEGLI